MNTIKIKIKLGSLGNYPDLRVISQKLSNAIYVISNEENAIIEELTITLKTEGEK